MEKVYAKPFADLFDDDLLENETFTLRFRNQRNPRKAYSWFVSLPKRQEGEFQDLLSRVEYKYSPQPGLSLQARLRDIKSLRVKVEGFSELGENQVLSIGASGSNSHYSRCHLKLTRSRPIYNASIGLAIHRSHQRLSSFFEASKTFREENGAENVVFAKHWAKFDIQNVANRRTENTAGIDYRSLRLRVAYDEVAANNRVASAIGYKMKGGTSLWGRVIYGLNTGALRIDFMMHMVFRAVVTINKERTDHDLSMKARISSDGINRMSLSIPINRNIKVIGAYEFEGHLAKNQAQQRFGWAMNLDFQAISRFRQRSYLK
eukprot:TRINITY_DN7032_c0_g1_i4.p1 TRINITY_DN7032_c0_g1~~TRINITY_DN7032_c0_g1_i4.p1  ORF type:complete len:319 (-),score=7.35 TRINITY_DN7032_c0_g1_i4:349-1305(-)